MKNSLMCVMDKNRCIDFNSQNMFINENILCNNRILGKTLIIGHNLWMDLPKNPILNNLNIIVTYNVELVSKKISIMLGYDIKEYFNENNFSSYAILGDEKEKIFIVGSLSLAFVLAKKYNLLNDVNETMVIGGCSLFKEAIKYVDTMYLTYLEKSYDGNIFFPEFSPDDWVVTDSQNINSIITGKVVKLERKI